MGPTDGADGAAGCSGSGAARAGQATDTQRTAEPEADPAGAAERVCGRADERRNLQSRWEGGTGAPEVGTRRRDTTAAGTDEA